MDIPDLRLEINQVSGADINQIDYIEKPITYHEFFTEYLLRNKPCVFGSWATNSWRSRAEWVKNNEPNFDYLVEKFGNAEGPAANCEKEEFCSHPKENKSLKDYVHYLKEYRQSGYSEDYPCLYLKDWHFTRLFPEYEAYITPVFFQSDWLNEFWDSREDQEDDYRFVYIGPKGSWTPFHADVFRSYSWSANICGKKKWIFFPPGEEDNLKDKFGNLAYDINSEDVRDPERYPGFAQLMKKFTITQNPGEIIFVPSGWHHQVHNMEDTISINHNWINGCNIILCWNFIKDSLLDVQKQIEDCREMDGWHQQCQLILKASSGIDYLEFYNFVQTISAKRLNFLKHCITSGNVETDLSGTEKTEGKTSAGSNCKSMQVPSKTKEETNSDPRVFQGAKVSSQPCYLTRNHAIFDISQIRRVIEDMISDTVFKELDYSALPQVPQEFLKNIDLTLLNSSS